MVWSLSLVMAMASVTRSHTIRRLAYGQEEAREIEVHAPVGADGEAPTVVVLRPPGVRRQQGWRSGKILAGRGLLAVVAAVGGESDALKDAAQACAWARDNAARFGGDPERLFVYGRAKGADLAALLALDPQWLADAGAPRLSGAVGLLGHYDFGGVQAAALARPDTPPLLLVADREDSDAGPLARALRIVGGQVAEIRCPELEGVPLAGLLRGLRLRLIALDEVERFIRLCSLAPAV